MNETTLSVSERELQAMVAALVWTSMSFMNESLRPSKDHDKIFHPTGGDVMRLANKLLDKHGSKFGITNPFPEDFDYSEYD